MINILWCGMILTAIFSGICQVIFSGNHEAFNVLTEAVFQNAHEAVKISIGLIGVLSFWLGILGIIDKSGVADKISHILSPLFRVIMKDIPANSPAISSVVLNMAANFLGLDNAATPVGLKAMEQLQKHNNKKDELSDAQILFLILNASSVTLIPITIFMYRAQMGATRPTEVFIPILLATSISTITGFLIIAVKQKIDLTNPILIKLIGGFIAIIVGISTLFSIIPPENRLVISAVSGNIILFSLLGIVLITAIKNKINCYEVFIDGAKQGFDIAIKILPYLVAMLVAIGMLRASGILDSIVMVIKDFCLLIGVDGAFADALPTAIMKPLSGSGARAMMIETMKNFGADSFAAFTSSIIQGSTETTFYVLTVYCGAVSISKLRYALKYALWSDFAGIIAAIFFSYIFYGFK